jgi:hypothetical protein
MNQRKEYKAPDYIIEESDIFPAYYWLIIGIAVMVIIEIALC